MKEKWSIPQEGLKLLAAACMLIDHVGMSRFPEALWLRCIGRLAFPIYCFFLAEGFRRTHSRGRYLIRLLVVAAVSEPAFDRMVHGIWFTMEEQNVLWTLALGLVAIACVELPRSRGKGWMWAMGLAGAALCCMLGDWLSTDYGSFGVALCFLFWAFWQEPLGPALCAGGFLAMCFAYEMAPLPGTWLPIEAFGVLAVPLLCLYRGRRCTGSKAAQWAFYWFYPVHMLLLGLLP